MLRRKKAVSVLGAGPAGLLAAHSAERMGWEVTVFSAADQEGAPRKSELHGCQYLHQFIPGLGLPTKGEPVSYQLSGTVEEYRRKVYGDGWNGQVSPDEYGPEAKHPAWDLRKAYDALWANWAKRITPLELTPRMAQKVSSAKNHVVLCTVPAPALCLKPEDHKFTSQSIWAMGSMVGTGAQWAIPYRPIDFSVECNGHDAPRWYRAATVFGQSTLEWPAGPRPPIAGIVQVQKPLSTDCDCHLSRNWHRIGRYGKWSKGVLVHESYFEAPVMAL